MDAHTLCVHCLGLEQSIHAPSNCVSCAILGGRLCEARLAALKASSGHLLRPSGAPPAKWSPTCFEAQHDNTELQTAALHQQVAALSVDGEDCISLFSQWPQRR
ncbi:hypothetical protein AAFF_G00371390 [Aldrovandia affinis]|uniref:Uncharacterized protein n=1 Tax=Aldrovandia affinis TaxID=143900 RepID=A0AAD7SGS3_9TELE|nr:hypothetical protein AAFF_G00371390 [Aldrovandia affinis]